MVAASLFDARIARARFRAWHRGTREADLMIGGYFDRYHRSWDDADLHWFEALLDADEADVLAWAMGVGSPPDFFAGEQLAALKMLDYVTIS